MASPGEIFMLDEEVAFRGRSMRVTGRAQLEGSNGQLTFRYVLSEPASAAVILEEGEGRFALMRPLPSAAELRTAGNTIAVGAEKYTLVGVRKLNVLDLGGAVPGIAPKVPVILSGVFEGPMGTLMREMVPGMTVQQYYLLKPLEAGEILSAARYAAKRDAESRAAGNRALDGD